MDKQEGLLDGDYVGSLLVILLGVIIGISVGKPDSEKVGCWLGRILVRVINIEIGNREGF